MCAKIAYGFWKKRSTDSSICSLSCEKKRKKLAASSINQSVKSQKQCVNPRILLLWQNVCEEPSTSIHRRPQQLNTLEISLRRILHKDLGHTKFNWFRSWRQMTIQCVFASISGPAIDLQKILIFSKKNHLIRWSSFWS